MSVYDDILNDINTAPPEPQAGRGMLRQQPEPSGPKGLMGYVEAPVAGLYGAASKLGGAVEAGAQLVGATDFAKQARDFSERQAQTAATYTSPDQKNYQWYDPRSIAYDVLRGAPEMAGVLGGALVGGPIGAGAVAYPFAVGSNVERTEAENGPLDRGGATKAALLGAPEAALNAWSGGRLGGMIHQGVEGVGKSAIAGAAASQAAVQGLASAGQDFIAQQMGDPNRPIASRMQEMIHSAFSGGVTGALMGAGIHAISPIKNTAKDPPPEVTKEALVNSIDGALGRAPPSNDALREAWHQNLAEAPRYSDTQTPSERQAAWQQAQQPLDAAAAEAARQKAYEEGTGHPPGEPPPPTTPPTYTPSARRAEWEAQAAAAEPGPRTYTPGERQAAWQQAQQPLDAAAAEAARQKAYEEGTGHPPGEPAPAPAEPPAPAAPPPLPDETRAAVTKTAGTTLAEQLDLTNMDAARKSFWAALPKDVVEDGMPLKNGPLLRVGKALGFVDDKNVLDQSTRPPPEPTLTDMKDEVAQGKAAADAQQPPAPSSPAPSQAATDFVQKMAKARDQVQAKQQSAEATGDTHAAPAASGPYTQGDVDVAHVVASRGSALDAFRYIAQNGESGLFKTVADLLAKKGVDAPIKFSSPEGTKFAALQPGEEAGMGYDSGSNTIHIFDSANLTRNVLHEGVHVGTVKAQAAGGPNAQKMQSLYDHVKAQSPGNKAYGLRDVYEFIAEGYTNQPFRDFLASIPAPNEKVSMWQAFKNAVAGLLGAKGPQATALDRLMEYGQGLMTENAQLPRTGGVSPMRASLATPQGVEDSTKPYFQKLDDVREQVRELGDSFKVGAQKALLVARNAPDIVNALANRFGIPSAVKFLDAQLTADARINTHSKADLVALRALRDLPEAERAKFWQVADATRAGVDARKPVQDLPLETRNNPDLMKVYNETRRAYMSMSPEGKAAYDMSVAMNQGHRAFMLAQSLQNYVRDTKLGDKGLIAGFENDLAKERQFDNDAHTNPLVGRDKAVQQFAKRIAGIQDYLDTGKSADLDPKTRVGLQAMLDVSNSEMKGIQSGVPYFRSGRQGDYFVSGALPVDKNGLPDQAAIDRLRPLLDKAKFGDLALNRMLGNPRMYARLETREQAQRLHDLFSKAQEAGILDKEQPIASGLAEEQAMRNARPTLLNEVIDAMQANRPDTEGLSDEEVKRINDVHARNVTEVARQLMDVLPNSSQAKVSAKRRDVQLYSKDIDTGLTQGSQAYGRLLANMSTVGDKGDALSAMRREMDAVKHDGTKSIVDKELAQNALKELLIRDSQRPVGQPNSFIAKAKALTYLFELASPSYALTLLSQNATLGLPELGSRVGYVKASKALAGATLDSFRAMKGMMTGADWTSAGLRADALEAGGLSKEKAEFLTKLDNMGKMTSSAYTHMLMGPAEEGSGLREKISRVSTAYTRYAELQPRIQVALAAKQAGEAKGLTGDKLYKFASDVIDGSQFNYDAATMPRIMSRAGPLGEMAPLMTQFWRFRTELTHKLYRSFEEGFANGEGKEWSHDDRKQARSFLAGHLAAMTVLAGTLGLPMVGVLASVYDKLADWATGDPTHDITASYRQHLADVFGPAVGEAIARGAPRLAGTDFSHLGEAKVAPGISEALTYFTEKRKFEDAERDWLKSVAGPTVGTATNLTLGMRDIYNGDYLRGLQKMAPEGLRGPIEAAQLARYGYRDKTGQVLRINGQPLTATAQDMVMKAVGIDPAKEAEQSEVQRTAIGLRTRQQIQSQIISQHLMQAQMRGDRADFAHWARKSDEFSQDYPGVAPPIAHFGQAMNEKMRQNAIGLYGITPNNIVSRGMLGYANSHQ